MQSLAIVLDGPKRLSLRTVTLQSPAAGDVFVAVKHSGISTGTEKLFWSGDMPPFPGMGYPLVPGYEALGTVMEAARGTGFKAGDTVFIPGANCYEDARGLFGAASAGLVAPAEKLVALDAGVGAGGALLALAATAHHALTAADARYPDLIIGHGVLGRLLARLTLLAGQPAPRVWEIDPARMGGADGYEVLSPEEDPRSDYQAIYDASGDAGLLNDLIARLAPGGEVVLAGFYPGNIQFAFAPAFLREARLRIAAEWMPEDMAAIRDLIDAGRLDLGAFITHEATAEDAPKAYETAFSDPACLKMILNWEGPQ